jgi:hypothetical protein
MGRRKLPRPSVERRTKVAYYFFQYKRTGLIIFFGRKTPRGASSFFYP